MSSSGWGTWSAAPTRRTGAPSSWRLTERGLEAEAAGREAIAEIRDAWAALIGEPTMARLESDLRRLRNALWPPA